MEFLIIWQEQFHVALQQLADQLLVAPQVLLVQGFVLLLFCEYGVQVLCHRDTLHQI